MPPQTKVQRKRLIEKKIPDATWIENGWLVVG
jgi:hypothetical protein